MRSAIKTKVVRGSDWTELMDYFGEQKGKELSLSTVASLRTGRFWCLVKSQNARVLDF